MQNVVVTFKVNSRQKEIIDSLIKDAEISFLLDYDRSRHPGILQSADALLAWNPPREFTFLNIKPMTRIKFVQLLSAGYDHIDLNEFPHGCKIASNNGAYAGPMAEHILAMVLAVTKKLFINHKKLSEGVFNQRDPNLSIKDSVFGILGYGGIGKATAKLIRPFGSKIYAVNSSGRTDEKVDMIGTLEDLNYVLENSDIIIVALPLTNETKDLIRKKELALMKPHAILINVARGQILNEKDLYEHLKSHPDFYAGIDAWWSEPFSEGEFKVNYPFFDLPNILGSPHNSAVVTGSLLEGLKRAVKNLNVYLRGQKPKHIIN